MNQTKFIYPGYNCVAGTITKPEWSALLKPCEEVVEEKHSFIELKLKDARIAQEEDAKASGSSSLNTASTSRGKQFPAVSPGGTQGWLIGASSIHYASSFAGKFKSTNITEGSIQT